MEVMKKICQCVSGTTVRSNIDETAAQKNIIHRKKWQNSVVRSRQLYFAGVRKNIGLLANFLRIN
jgi:hypothetical protein